MIIEQAIVTGRQGKRVEVELQRASACSHCDLAKGCGTGALGRLLGRRSKPLFIETDGMLNPGDQISLGLSESALVKTSLLVYGFPLLGMLLIGVLASTLMLLPEWQVALASFLGFIGGYKLSSWISLRLDDELLSPVIIDDRLNPVAETRS